MVERHGLLNIPVKNLIFRSPPSDFSCNHRLSSVSVEVSQGIDWGSRITYPDLRIVLVRVEENDRIGKNMCRVLRLDFSFKKRRQAPSF